MKLKPIDPETVIRKNRIRGKNRETLEKFIDDADVLYAIRRTKEDLEALLTDHFYFDTQSHIDRAIQLFHRLILCSAAKEMMYEYTYQSVVAEETKLIEMLKDPLAKSFEDNIPDYLLRRAIEACQVVLLNFKKTRLLPSNSSSMCQQAALAMAIYVSKAWASKEAAPSKKPPVNIAEVSPLKMVSEAVAIFTGNLSKLSEPVPGEKDITEQEANMLMKAEKGEEQVNAVMTIYPTANCMSDDGKYQIVILPKGVKISRKKKTIQEAWEDCTLTLLKDYHARVRMAKETGDPGSGTPEEDC